MLFQPTNISPSTRGAIGNGTVDATKPLTVSFQVNGNSPLTAFSITIYLNNSASTQKYTTGKITSGCPFYGTDYAGNVKFFSYTIPAATLSSSGITNGNEYKLIITQWWSDDDSVVQASAAAFITRATPSLTMDAISSPISTRSYTFGATYTQAQGDTLNWVRWMLAYSGQTDEPFYDTQNIYGTAQLAMTYDGLLKNTSYAVRCIIQTEHGIEADTGWKTFSVSYSSVELGGAIQVSKACGRSAISLSWPAIQYVPATATGSYTMMSTGVLSIESGGSVVWNNVNNSTMSFTAPWTLFYKTQLVQATTTLLTVAHSTGNIAVAYNSTNRVLTVSVGQTAIYQRNNLVPTAKIVLVLTPTILYINFQEASGGLYPSTSLQPSTTRYPKANTQNTNESLQQVVSYTQGTISRLTLGQSQACTYLQVLKGVAEQDQIESAYIDNTYDPVYDNGSYFCTNFPNDLGGGNLSGGGSSIVGLAVYRREGTSSRLQHIGDYPLSVSDMLDYGPKNRAGPYTYYLFPIGETTYYYDPLESDSISMCDWNWTVLECSERAEGNSWYSVDAEYQFGKNLSSGSMSNNNAPNVLENFTPYPTVQISPSNYKGGTLQSMIGAIDYTCGDNYSDSISLRDAIMALSTSKKTMFLKNRKGDLLKIRPSGAITMETMDNTKEQAQTVSFPWVEVGDASDVAITLTSADSYWSGGEAG